MNMRFFAVACIPFIAAMGMGLLTGEYIFLIFGISYLCWAYIALDD